MIAMVGVLQRPGKKAVHTTSALAGGGRARAACLAFGSGFGAGSAYTECQREVSSTIPFSPDMHRQEAPVINPVLSVSCIDNNVYLLVAKDNTADVGSEFIQ